MTLSNWYTPHDSQQLVYSSGNLGFGQGQGPGHPHGPQRVESHQPSALHGRLYRSMPKGDILPPPRVALDSYNVGRLLKMVKEKKVTKTTLAKLWPDIFTPEGTVRASYPPLGNPYFWMEPERIRELSKEKIALANGKTWLGGDWEFWTWRSKNPNGTFKAWLSSRSWTEINVQMPQSERKKAERKTENLLLCNPRTRMIPKCMSGPLRTTESASPVAFARGPGAIRSSLPPSNPSTPRTPILRHRFTHPSHQPSSLRSSDRYQTSN